MSSQVYPFGKSKLLDQSWSWTGNTINAMLLTPAAVFNPANKFVADIVANEVPAAGGYSRQTLGSKTQTFNAGTGLVEFSSAAAVYAALNDGSVGAVALFEDTGSDATAILISFNDFPAISTNGTDVTLTPPSPSGWFTY